MQTLRLGPVLSTRVGSNTERGIYRHGMVQSEQVKTLGRWDGLSDKKKHERARVFEMFAACGYKALFGVKCHAGLAHIERKWMYLKRFVRPYLNGKLPKLEALLKSEWHKWHK